MMTKWIWVGTAAVLFGFLYLTKAILLPFLMGLAIAYFLDPVTDKLEERGLSRGLSTSLVLVLFFTLIIGVLLAFWPVLQSQVTSVAVTLPKTLANLRPWLNDLMISLSQNFGIDFGGDLNSVLASVSEDALARAQSAATSALKGGLAFFNLLTLLLISPVVAFYLLRDWDLIIAKIDGWLPPAQASTIRTEMGKVDTVLAGFVRGQLLVSLSMGVLYGIGWSLVGLDFGVVLGVLAGVMAFVPFVGALFAAVVAVIIAIGQWGFDPAHIGMVVGVFVVVQIIEGAFLTPRLVGTRVGLHPVWVLFAVFAGGEVMGFVGVLIAVPAAAALAVLVRFLISRYLDHYDITPVLPDTISIDPDTISIDNESKSDIADKRSAGIEGSDEQK